MAWFFVNPSNTRILILFTSHPFILLALASWLFRPPTPNLVLALALTAFSPYLVVLMLTSPFFFKLISLNVERLPLFPQEFSLECHLLLLITDCMLFALRLLP
jgi:hypothetical protein